MNSKGFTLVELLAVIVILSLLALITSTAVTKIVKDSKDDLSLTQMALIKSSAETWIADNLDKLPEVGSCAYLTLEDLKNYGILDDNVIDPKDSSRISDELKIKITSSLSKYGNPVNSVKVNPDSVDGCVKIYEPICTAVTQATKTTGNVPQGNYEKGDEYTCNVDGTHNYIFFVLSTDDDKVNLIMDSNIRRVGTVGAYIGEPVKELDSINDGSVAWINKEDYNDDDNYDGHGYTDKGPLTVMKYLNDATSSWREELTIDETYIDEGGKYGEFHLTGKARLPKLSEIGDVRCTESLTSCPIWLSNYLAPQSSAQRPNLVLGIYGYWILASHETFYDYAWYAQFDVNALNQAYIDDSAHYGVRPVISVSKIDIS